MRKAGLATLAAGAILAGAAATAWGAPAAIVAGNGLMNVYNPTTYTHDGGTVATMTWAGGTGSHDVTATQNGSDGQPLFRSATIASGATPVNGTQFLPAASYPFFCTVHGASMSGTLTVTGSPLPRPTVEIKILSKSLDKVASSGKLKVQTTTTGSNAKLTAKLGAKTIAPEASVPGNGTTQLKLSKSGRKALAGKTTAKVAVTGTVDFGTPSTVKRKLK